MTRTPTDLSTDAGLEGIVERMKDALQACMMLIDNAEFADTASMDVSAVSALAHEAFDIARTALGTVGGDR